MDVEAVRLVLNDSSTGIVTLTVVDALPFAKLEGLLKLCHVLRMNSVPVSGKIVHLDENVPAVLTHPCLLLQPKR